ncbi:MAG: DUF2256 domain-containing protein [Phycisphaerales bacterium]
MGVRTAATMATRRVMPRDRIAIHAPAIDSAGLARLYPVRTCHRFRNLRMPPIPRHPVPPPKQCACCLRPFTWRKKWERDWENVRYCSDACRRRGPAETTAARPVTNSSVVDRSRRGRR